MDRDRPSRDRWLLGYVLLLLIGLFSSTQSALAQELAIALRNSVAPLKPEPSTRLAAEGLALGASPEEVVRAIQAIDPDMPIERFSDKIALALNGFTVTSEPFLSQIKASNMKYRSGQQVWTRVEVSFALPTTGGEAIGIGIQHGSAGVILTGAALRDQLVRDYGKPSAGELYALNDPVKSLQGSLAMEWRFGAIGLLPCSRDCMATSDPIELEQLEDYRQRAAEGTFARISILASANKSRAGIWAIDLSLEDVATKALSLSEGVRQLTEAALKNRGNTGASK